MSDDRKTEFGDLRVGDHFISWPVPGDNSGHGGYLGSSRLFTKVRAGLAVAGNGVRSDFASDHEVIKVQLG